MAEVADRVKSLITDIIKDRRSLVKILSIMVILLLALILRVHNSNQSEISVEAAADTSEAKNEELYVDIGGAVHRPGVYKVANGTRLYEVIELAGGLRSDADTDSVNQAAFVEDGVKVIIPIFSEQNGETNTITQEGVVPQQGTDISGTVNINSADKETLKTLPGIGDVIADRIIEYRSLNRFQAKEDIMNVKGIGNSIFDKIKEEISI